MKENTAAMTVFLSNTTCTSTTNTLTNNDSIQEEGVKGQNIVTF